MEVLPGREVKGDDWRFLEELPSSYTEKCLPEEGSGQSSLQPAALITCRESDFAPFI